MAVFRGLPRGQHKVGIIRAEEAGLLAVERTRCVEGFVLRGDFIFFQRRHLFPAELAQFGVIGGRRAGDDVAEAEMSALAGTIIRVPVIVHDVGEDGSGARAELGWPLAAIDIAERDQRSIERHDGGGQAILLRRNPVLHREPFMSGAGVHVLRRIDDSVLNLILKLRMVHGEREGEVDALLGVDFFLGQVFDEFNFLLMVEQANFGRDFWSVGVAALQTRDRSPWRARD